MRRRQTGRATAASVMLILAAGSFGGAPTVAIAAPASDRSGPSEVADPTAPVRSSIKPLRDGVGKRPVAHGSLAQASDRKAGASPARMADPFTRVPSDVSGGGPVPRSPVAVPVEATVTASPPIGHAGFNGLSRSSGPDTNGEPPDPYLAVGPEHVMQVVNSSFRTTDRQGLQLDIGSLAGFIDTFSFAGLGTASWFDPHIVYDSLQGRWLLTVDGFDCAPDGVDSFYGNGYLFFATSDTTDPTGDWTASYFSAPDYLIDYTAPGTSTDKFAFGSNMFDMFASGSCLAPDAYAFAEILFIDWADWLGTDGSFAYGGFDTASTLFAPRVAVQAPATSGRLHIIAEYADGPPGPNAIYISVTGTVTSGWVTERVQDLTAAGIIGEFLPPPAPHQPGSDTIADAVDPRPTQAIWQNNRLTYVSTYPCTPAGDSMTRDCVRVSQLNTSAVNSVTDPTIAQDFLISENGKDAYMGGVGVAGNGTLHVVWTRSSATAGDYPSSYAAYQLPTDAANTVSPQELLKAGTGAYTGERWGDYVGVAQDPLVPSAVWQGNQYAGTGAEWKTWVSRLQPLGTTYVPIAPARVLDSRIGNGLSGKFTANTARTWQVAGRAGIPANAVAVTGNLTVTQQESAGFFAVTPTATNTPPSSSLNFPLGENRANNLTVPLSATGTLSAVYKAGTGRKSHLVFDVTGYYLAADSGATFKPLTPTRVLDTRISTGLAGTFLSDTPRTLVIGGTHGIPLTATAITGNLTVTQQSAAGFLAVTKTPIAVPPTSTLNFPIKDNRANGVFAPLTAAGALSIVYKSAAGARTHVILDVTGYFEPGTAGLRFVPLNPSRVMDTRSTAVLSTLHGVFHANSARLLPVDGHWGVPIGAHAISANLTVTQQTAGGFIAVSPTPPPPVPATSTLNFPLADNRANGLVTPLNGSGDTYLVYVGGTGRTTHLVLDLSGYFE